MSVQNKLKTAIVKTDEIIDGIPNDDLEQFRKKMKAKANKLAANQSELLSLLAELKEFLPAGEANMNSRHATPLDAQQSYDQGSKVQVRCIQYTSMYVAFTLFNNCQINCRAEAGKQLRQNLKQALAPLRMEGSEQPIFAEEFQKMVECVDTYTEEPPAKKPKKDRVA